MSTEQHTSQNEMRWEQQQIAHNNNKHINNNNIFIIIIIIITVFMTAKQNKETPFVPFSRARFCMQILYCYRYLHTSSDSSHAQAFMYSAVDCVGVVAWITSKQNKWNWSTKKKLMQNNNRANKKYIELFWILQHFIEACCFAYSNSVSMYRFQTFPFRAET